MSNITETDVAIVGGGIAGSAAAVLLGRQGINTTLIDPHENFPREFRCEKFNDDQVNIITRMGLSDIVFPHLTAIDDVWVSRMGRMLNIMDYPHFGFSYQEVIAPLRREAENTTQLSLAKVKSVGCKNSRQYLELSDGTEISARIAVIANGLNPGLHNQLGIEREFLSKQHCQAIGFDVIPESDNQFSFGSFPYWPDDYEQKLAYFTIFRCGDSWRANLFGYWGKQSDFLTELRTSPTAALESIMPRLCGNIGRFEVDGRVHIRPIDLYQARNVLNDGIVFVGDAYSTSCPGAGTGTGKALVDVERLCSTYIPQWLETPGLVLSSNIADYYSDDEKLEYDAASFQQAFFLRSISTQQGLQWMTKRWLRFFYHWSKGKLNGYSFEKLT